MDYLNFVLGWIRKIKIRKKLELFSKDIWNLREILRRKIIIINRKRGKKKKRIWKDIISW